MAYKCRNCGDYFTYEDAEREFDSNIPDELYRMGETYDKYFRQRLCASCAEEKRLQDLEEAYGGEDEDLYDEYFDDEEEDYA